MKTIALASSSERPRRPIGTPVTRAALFSGVPVKRVNMPVSVGPGATPFTRILGDLERHRLGDAFDGVITLLAGARLPLRRSRSRRPDGMQRVLCNSLET